MHNAYFFTYSFALNARTSSCGRDLVRSIPGLARLVGRDHAPSDMSKPARQQTLNRWKFLLCKLVRAISDVVLVVLVLDDLQWCDDTTLDVIRAIVTDSDVTRCLYVGCYRDDDDVMTRRVTDMIASVKSRGVDVFTITLGEWCAI